MSDDVEIRFTVEGDKQLEDSLKRIQSRLEQLKAELKATRLEFGANSTEAGKAGRAYSLQAAEAERLASQLGRTRGDLKNLETKMQEVTITSGKLEDGIRSASGQLEKFSGKAAKVGSILKKEVATPLSECKGLFETVFNAANSGTDTTAQKTEDWQETLKSIYDYGADTFKKKMGFVDILGLGAADTALLGLMGKALEFSFNSILDGVEAMSKPGEELAEALKNVGPNLEEYQRYIDGAASALEDFNIEQTSAGELIKTYDDQIASSIDKIHTIVNTAASQSRMFTESEYAEIQNLIGTVEECASKKVETYQQQQKVVQAMAEQEAFMTKERSAELVKAAEETRDQMIAAANAQYQGVLGEAVAMYEAGNITKEQYDEMCRNARNAYYEQERMADEAYANTAATISEAYFQQNIANNESLSQWNEYYEAMDLARADHEDRMAYYRDLVRQGYMTQLEYDNKYADSLEKIEDDQAALRRTAVQNGAALFDEATSDSLSYWLTMQSQTKLYGGKVSEEGQKFVDTFTGSMNDLPSQIRAVTENTWKGYEEKTKEMMPRILRNTTSAAMNIINTIKDTMQITSPSRVMRRLAGYFWEGWENQSDKSGKEAAAQAAALAGKINDSFKNEIGFDSGITDLAGRGRQIADAVEQRISANINPARQEILVSMPQGNAGTTLNQTNNFYSPEALSPAETARLNRINLRRTLQAVR